MGQHGIERDPTTLSSTLIQPALLNGWNVLQLTTSDCSYSSTPITKHASTATMRHRDGVRRIWLGERLPRLCDHDLTTKARNLHKLLYCPLRVLARAPTIKSMARPRTQHLFESHWTNFSGMRYLISTRDISAFCINSSATERLFSGSHPSIRFPFLKYIMDTIFYVILILAQRYFVYHSR